jgi:transposase
MKKPPTRLVGIDVSKDDLDLACRPVPTRWRVANASAGIAPGLAPLRRLQPALIGLEATGGWQGALVAALAAAKLPVAVMTPRQLRDFAQATGPLATTEALDAGVLAHCAEAVHPTPRPLPDAMTPQLEARRQRRRQLLAMWVAARQRMALAHPTVRDSRARPMDDLQRLIDATAAEIAPRLRTTPVWRETADGRPSTPGLGPVRSATLPAALPE